MPPDIPPDDEPIPDTLRMLTADDTVRAQLAMLMYALGVDELRVLVRIGERLQAGRRTYGQLDLPTDTRDFRAEAREEVEDALAYFAMSWLVGQARQEVA